MSEALTKIDSIDPSLRCEFTRTKGEGTHISQTRGVLRGRKYKVTYDLNLCRFCGDIDDGSRTVCPWKFEAVRRQQEVNDRALVEKSKKQLPPKSKTRRLALDKDL